MRRGSFGGAAGTEAKIHRLTGSIVHKHKLQSDTVSIQREDKYPHEWSISQTALHNPQKDKSAVPTRFITCELCGVI